MHILINKRHEDAPLFRFEYVRKPQRGIPSGHVHIHAHRDEISFLLVHAGRRRPKERNRRSDYVPALQTIHFPVGGPRFRPCMEDVCKMVIEEFGVDAAPSAAAAIRAGREEWRRLQIRTVVRDSPEDAADTLRRLGYAVTAPLGGHAATSVEKLRQY